MKAEISTPPESAKEEVKPGWKVKLEQENEKRAKAKQAYLAKLKSKQ